MGGETIVDKSAIKNLPNNSKFIKMMKETVGSLIKSRNSPRFEQDALGQASKIGIPSQILGGISLKLIDNTYELTPEICKALSSTRYTS